MDHYCIFTTTWGPFALAARGRRVLATYLPGPTASELAARVHTEWPRATRDDQLLGALQDAVRRYFAGEPVAFRFTLDPGHRTPFQNAVLSACRRISYGRVRTYAELAVTAGSPRAARAVGSVMAHNPAPLLIPCHRVVASDGGMGGFSGAGGVALKEALLDLEGARACTPA